MKILHLNPLLQAWVAGTTLLKRNLQIFIISYKRPIWFGHNGLSQKQRRTKTGIIEQVSLFRVGNHYIQGSKKAPCTARGLLI